MAINIIKEGDKHRREISFNCPLCRCEWASDSRSTLFDCLSRMGKDSIMTRIIQYHSQCPNCGYHCGTKKTTKENSNREIIFEKNETLDVYGEGIEA